jgi:hypothetical protein
MSKDDVLKCISQGQPHTFEWQEPVRFDDIETPPISADLLPPVLRDFVLALADYTETPYEMAFGCVLGMCSTALTGKILVSPKPGWFEPVNTYWFIELLPSNLKSPVFKACTLPLKQWENEQNSKLAPEIAKSASKRKSQEKYIERLRNDAAKAQDDATREGLFQKIMELESALEEPLVPVQLFANNVTPESLENYTYQQGGRFAVLTDEGGVIETLTGLYSGGRANVDLLLKGIDGGDVPIGRKDRHIIMSPLLTFVLCVQPRIREEMSRNKALQGNGALERFIYIIPRSKIGYRHHDTQPVPEHIQAQYNAAIRQLLEITKATDSNDVQKPYVLILSPEAYGEFHKFRLWLEPKLRPLGELYICQGWAGKVAGYALRIAGLTHAVEHGVQNTQISLATMQKALWIAYPLIQHARVAYTLMGLDEKVTNAQRIFEWVITTGRSQFTQTELTTAMKHHIKAPQIKRAVEELSERHILKAKSTDGTGTKLVTTYVVNPRLFHSSAPVTSETSVSSSQVTEVSEITGGNEL